MTGFVGACGWNRLVSGFFLENLSKTRATNFFAIEEGSSLPRSDDGPTLVGLESAGCGSIVRISSSRIASCRKIDKSPLSAIGLSQPTRDSLARKVVKSPSRE
jgi:hypothetical protein